MLDYFDIEDWMIIGPLSEELADEREQQKQIERGALRASHPRISDQRMPHLVGQQHRGLITRQSSKKRISSKTTNDHDR